MSTATPTSTSLGQSRSGSPTLFRRIALVGFTAIALIGVYLGTSESSSALNQNLGNVGILLSALFATVLCGAAARRRNAASRGWTLMTVATLVWTLGMAAYAYNGAARDHDYPFPSLAHLGFLGYVFPAVAALFAFPRPSALLISRLRVVMDALVITLSVVFVSLATVLREVLEVIDLSTVAGWTCLAYPIVDVTVCSIVLTLGMRQPPSLRSTWLCLGGGLLILAVSDSIYVWLLAEGKTALTGTPLAASWMLAMFLIGLAALARPNSSAGVAGRNWNFALQLIPYLPVLAALPILAVTLPHRDPILLTIVMLLLVFVAVRQVMIVYENVSLTSDLEAKVAARTAELHTLGFILTSSSDAIVGVSLDGIITAWNPAAEKLYGYRAEEVIGRPPDFLREGGLQGMPDLLARARNGRELSDYEVTWSRPDGSTVPVSLTVSPIMDGSGVTGISIFGRDVTERKRAEAALEQARQEALESSRFKSEFLATMSHEIRTPMNAVIGLTSLLLETDLDEVQLQYAEGVRGAGEALLNVINDILDFSKLEAGKVVLDPTDFHPRQLVEDVGALLAPAAFEKRLELIAYCMPGVPETVRGDSGRIRQILLNLASNAVKFTSDGEVVIKVKALPGRDREVRLRFEVRDTGIGIAEADRDRLFESFSQADASTTRRFGGTGLGLAICRRLVEVMGGEISVDSEVGIGSTFWFEIPLPLGTSASSTEESVSPDLSTELSVLVVDDNATNRTILEAQFTSWRMRVDLVENAESALARLRERTAKGQPYDLAVLDMYLPEMSGLDLARTITADPELRGLPMIVLTSGLQIDPALLQEAGIGQWLTKPVRSSELYDKLMRLMAPPEVDARGRERGQHQRPDRTQAKGKILVVEDNALNQLVAEGAISRLGYEVHSVSDGAEAVEAVHRNDYSAVLMDCHMPVMDGFTATREIRKRENGRRTPIIAMTAGALSEDQQRCLAAGMDDYISKPVDLSALEKALDRWIPEASSAADRETNSVSADGSAPTGRPDAADDDVAGHREHPIDGSRLLHLRQLQMPNGSSMLTFLIDSFARRFSADQLDGFHRALANEDADLLQDMAHELKGASANLGAMRVTTLCRELEGAARGANFGQAADILSQLETELRRAQAALQGYAGAAI